MEEAAIDRGLAMIEEVGGSWADESSGEAALVLDSYRGALITLRAKYTFWPPSRLRHLREGLTILDGAVTAHPTQLEIRYLRLISCYYLPGFLGREASVREDLEAVVNLLEGRPNEYPAELVTEIASFLIDNGAVGKEDRMKIEAGLEARFDG